MRRLRFLVWDFFGCPGHPDDWPDDYFAYKFYRRRKGT